MKMLLDIHTHTIASGHAYSTIIENITFAKEKGIELVCVTDHAPAMPGTCHEYYFHNINAVPKKILDVEVFMGSELNVLDIDGSLDLEEYYIAKMDLVIASLHPMIFKPSTAIDNTQAILNVMENKYVDVIGHPGDPSFPILIDKLVEQSIKTGTLLEINNASLKKDSHRKGSDVILKQLLEICKKRDVPVVLGTDAHFATAVGVFDDAIELLNLVDFPQDLVLNTDVKKFKDYLNKGISL